MELDGIITCSLVIYGLNITLDMTCNRDDLRGKFFSKLKDLIEFGYQANSFWSINL